MQLWLLFNLSRCLLFLCKGSVYWRSWPKSSLEVAIGGEAANWRGVPCLTLCLPTIPSSPQINEPLQSALWSRMFSTELSFIHVLPYLWTSLFVVVKTCLWTSLEKGFIEPIRPETDNKAVLKADLELHLSYIHRINQLAWGQTNKIKRMKEGEGKGEKERGCHLHVAVCYIACFSAKLGFQSGLRQL